MATDASTIESRVRAFDPRYAGSEWDALVSTYTQASIRLHTKKVFYNVYFDAMAFWVLHYLALYEREQLNPNSSGPVTSLRTEQESIGFQQTALMGNVTDATFRETSWGKRYLSVRNTLPAAHIGLI